MGTTMNDDGWVDALGAEELPEGGRRLLRLAGREIALFHVDAAYYALDDSCPHAGASLAGGRLEGKHIVCRAHGLRFELATGCMARVAGFGTPVHPVRVRDGRVEIRLPIERGATIPILSKETP
ncbi:Rieske (2Fe-2S) domain protein [Leptothrix cholodnii SP-6]|uniref:Rieske (2Fe-2S) domain protein n=1 Tax=Leptothrix cholodnii (strain ATCC 51168 / LMG 8142 / SP-6) TaxID=395495 RepID=B1Y2U0_LEPCP|nr:Rieske (2Fe-2S) protein [Leptothrix cholodnii]ACB34432.1 Rieske (2Fe-2S) domain protein [Leptothrix cholodnii SP-6]